VTPPAIRKDRHLVEDAIGLASLSTPVGMAYFAGTGPKERICRECASFTVPAGLRSHPNKGGRLRRCRCAEFKRQKGGERGAAIDHDNRACKYFSPSDNPPPITEKPKSFSDHE
jgi:hypothetical protein